MFVVPQYPIPVEALGGAFIAVGQASRRVPDSVDVADPLPPGIGARTEGLPAISAARRPGHDAVPERPDLIDRRRTRVQGQTGQIIRMPGPFHPAAIQVGNIAKIAPDSQRMVQTPPSRSDRMGPVGGGGAGIRVPQMHTLALPKDVDTAAKIDRKIRRRADRFLAFIIPVESQPGSPGSFLPLFILPQRLCSRRSTELLTIQRIQQQPGPVIIARAGRRSGHPGFSGRFTAR